MRVELPVVIGKDSVQLANARITTAQSHIAVDGTLEHLAAPRVSAHLNAHVALSEVDQVANMGLDLNARGVPSAADADINVRSDDQNINVQNAKVTLGGSTIVASGPLKGGPAGSSLKFDANVAVSEIGTLLKLSSHPSGHIELAGNATMSGASDYHVTGTLEARNLSVQQGQTSLRNVNFTAGVEADPHQFQLERMRLAALGGDITGKLRVQDFKQLTLDARLHNFVIPRVLHELTNKQIGYDGTLSGPIQVRGDLKAKGTSGFSAEAHLEITPGTHGVPVSSRLNASYNGARDTVSIAKSFVALPHSRLDVAGTLGRQIDLHLESRNLNDFLPAAALASSGEPMTQFPVTLHNGTAVINAQVTGKLAAPRLSGNAALTQFSVEQRNFDRLAADFAASPSSAAIQNGILARSSLQAHFSGAIGLRKWSTTPQSPLSANVTIRNADVADVMALAGQPLNAASGSLAADAQISGTLGNPVGGANLSVGKGLLYGEPFDSLNVNAAFSDQLAELRKAELVDGPSQVTLHATFVHPRDSFSTGHIQAELSSNEWALSRLQTIQSRHPGLAGSVQLNASTAADVQSVKGKSTIAVRSLDADLAAHNLRDQTQTFGDLTGYRQNIRQRGQL